jgi:virulence factor
MGFYGMKKIRVGVIGLGAYAHVAHLPALSSLENVELTACMARTTSTVERVAEQFGFLKQYTSLNDLIKNSGVEAVFVVTPKETHYEMVVPLLENGVHVFCEKPMAMAIREAEEMVNCADKKGRVLMIGFNRRFAPVYENAKKEYWNKPPDVCVAFKNRPGRDYRSTMENAIHMVDLMRWFCGECVSIGAHAQFKDPYYETTAAALLRFDTGAIGMLLGNRTCGQWMERVELYGGGKTVIAHCPDEISVIDEQFEHIRKMTPLKMGWATLQEKMGFQQQVNAFIEAITTGKEPRTHGKDSLKTHILLDQILKKVGLPGMST